MRYCHFALACLLFVGTVRGDETTTEQWPCWRGPSATGAAPLANPPTAWSGSDNIRWKAAIPGRGSSTPIIWNDHVFVTTAIETQAEPAESPTDSPPAPGPGRARPGGRAGRGGLGSSGPPTSVYQFVVLALDRTTGAEVWRRVVDEETPHAGTHPTGTFASHSPVTDGQHLYAYFGSRGLYCLDMDGRIVWEKQFVKMQKRNDFGEGSSPAVFGDFIVIVCDHEGDSFITAFNKSTGEQLWKTPRDEPSSWATPLVVEVNGRPQVVTTGTNATRGYDLETGREIWIGPALTPNSIPSPVYSDGIAYLMSGFRGNALQAIRLADAKGDIAGSKAIVWTYDSRTPYVPSPLLYEDKLYFLSGNSGLLSCFDAKTGKSHYTERLPGIGNVYASIVGAANGVYVTSREGDTVVIKHGPTFEMLAQNTLGEEVDASAAIVGDALFLRASQHLYCIAED